MPDLARADRIPRLPDAIEGDAMGYVIAALSALLLGFVAGLATLKRSSRWCPACGAVLRCTECADRPTPFEAARRLDGR